MQKALTIIVTTFLLSVSSYGQLFRYPLAAGVPKDAIMFFTGSSCPTGWTELTAARGRYILALQSDGTIGQTIGTALTNAENRGVPAHSHTASATGHWHTSVTLTPSSHYHSTGLGCSYYLGSASGATTLYVLSSSGSSMNTDETQVIVNSSSSTSNITLSDSGQRNETIAPYVQHILCKKL